MGVEAPEGVREALRHRGLLPLLPQRHDDELVTRHVPQADEDEVAVANVDGAAWRFGYATGPIGLSHPADHLRPRIEHAADALEVALDGVVGDGDQRRRGHGW